MEEGLSDIYCTLFRTTDLPPPKIIAGGNNNC